MQPDLLLDRVARTYYGFFDPYVFFVNLAVVLTMVALLALAWFAYFGIRLVSAGTAMSTCIGGVVMITFLAARAIIGVVWSAVDVIFLLCWVTLLAPRCIWSHHHCVQVDGNPTVVPLRGEGVAGPSLLFDVVIRASSTRMLMRYAEANHVVVIFVALISLIFVILDHNIYTFGICVPR